MHDDFDQEPVPGLPELPPEGEKILWQGRPNWWALAWESLSLPWVIGYFIVLALWRFGAAVDLMPMDRAIAVSTPFLILGLIVVALLVVIAAVQAWATVYTVTNRRVAMRVGAALTITLNLPYRQIGSADLRLRKSGIGSISFDTLGETRFSYLMLWPHVRPWKMKKTQPTLRCIPDAARIAGLIGEAAQARISTPEVRLPDAAVPAE
ncbi:photosynthetic complex putative assembly protein PuhB [Pseudaestuariivita sp.]|uniref:photosynthetic complex putative assembly protein PuhB n=1 Tax=Pseudaestuariivita sp. TaxID=2211669 RepID=UPI0040594AB5